MASLDQSEFSTTSVSRIRTEFEFAYDYDEPRFYIISACILYQTIFLLLFLYTLIKTLMITSEEHKTSQYKKYQWLRIILILLSTCYLLKAFVHLFEFPDNLFIFHQIVESIATFTDCFFAISAVIAIWQIAILCNRYSYHNINVET